MTAHDTLVVIDAPPLGALAPQPGPSDVRRRLEDAVKVWLGGKSKHTVRSRLGDLRLFASFVRSEAIQDPVEGTLALIEGGQLAAETAIADWQTSMSERGLQSTSIARRIATLRSLTATLRRFGLPWDLGAVRGPSYRPYDRATGPDAKALDAKLDELEQLSAGDSEDPETLISARDYAMIVVLYHTAMRRDSLVTMTWSNMRLDTARPHAQAVVKGGSTRRFPLSRRSVAALHHWRRLRVAHLGRYSADATVFCGVSGRGKGRTLHPDSVYKRTKYAHGLSGPHGIRHTAATEVFDRSNGNLKLTSDLLGHANPATTRSYMDKQGHSAEEAMRLLAREEAQ